jgi:transmembrane sensor
MIDPGNEARETAIGAEAVRIHAADWILAKRTAGNWGEADQAALEAWLAESLAHRLAYLRLDAAWGRAHRLEALRRPLHEPAVPRPRRFAPIILRGAGVVAIVGVIAVAAGAYFQQPVMKTYATTIGRRETVALKDGSTVDLNTDTVLHVSDSGNSRTATLDKGEAYFQINHDASRPFVLSVAGHRITDLGTKFVVRDNGARLQVTLLEGRARFESVSPGTRAISTILTPGDVILADGEFVSVSKKPSRQLTDALGWRRGVLVFDNTTLADAASELNRYNRQKIVITDPSVARLAIVGAFPENDVQALTNTAQQVFGLRVAKYGDEIVISR